MPLSDIWGQPALGLGKLSRMPKAGSRWEYVGLPLEVGVRSKTTEEARETRVLLRFQRAVRRSSRDSTGNVGPGAIKVSPTGLPAGQQLPTCMWAGPQGEGRLGGTVHTGRRIGGR